MKPSIRFHLLLAGVCAALPCSSLLAQQPAAAPTPSVSTPAGEPPVAGEPPAGGPGAGKGRWKAAMAALTPEERQEFKAARQKALADPSVQAAKADQKVDPKAFHKAMHAAMLRADPNIQPILRKLHGGHMHRKDFQTT